jgi:glycine cleavage system aminomethyltransferase T
MVATDVALCRSRAGIADLSGVPVWELWGPPDAVADAVAHAAGIELEPGTAAYAAGAWWCAVTSSRVLVLGEQPAGVASTNLAEDYLVVGLLGPRAEAVLRAARGFEDLPEEFPAGTLALTGRPSVIVLREAGERFVVLVSRSRGTDLWRELLAAGRAQGAACVGRDAADLMRVRDGLPGCH